MVILPSSSFFSGTNPTPTEYENAVDLVAQASAQATAALASQTAAATSAQSAQGYSVSAGTSAETATQQAAAAATSAAGALASQNAAATSATAASSSATSASSSASNAATSATNASNSATSASGSATSAGTYATNAANSATAAANSASDAAATLANALTKSDNLASLSNKSTSRSNLGVAIGSDVQAWDADLDAIAAISSTSGLLKKTAANTWSLDTTSYHSGTLGLSQGGTGATDAAGARTALGLGTAATAAATSFLQTANNLSDVTAATARTNLGLGTVATLNTGDVLQAANNLSDLGNVVTARSSLGLSTLATTTPGTGVVTALGVNTGTAGSFVVNSGALGTPASGNLANCTFPTLNQNTTGTAAGLSATLGVASGGTGLSSLTAGYIPYGNGTGAFSSSSNLTYSGTTLTNNGVGNFLGAYAGVGLGEANCGIFGTSATLNAASMAFYTAGSERLRIASDGSVGIGTSSPAYKLDVQGQVSRLALQTTNYAIGMLTNTGGNVFFGIESSTGGSFATGTSAYSAVFNHAGAYSMHLATNNTVRATLDASGNLGLGVTPSAWASAIKAINIGTNASFATNNNNLVAGVNAYYDTAWRYISSSLAATQYIQNIGQHQWFTAASGTAGSAISFTQAMTLDASGNLGIGTSSPSYILDVQKSQNATTALNFLNNNAGANAVADIYINNGTSYGFLRQFGTGTAYANQTWVGTNTTNPLVFATNFTERMRIDSSGYVGIGTGAPGNYGKLAVYASSGYTNVAVVSGSADYRWYANSTSGDGGFQAVTSGLPLIFMTNSGAGTTERVRIDSSGNLLTGGKTSATANGGDVQVSKGISFPATQVACSDVNTLDDYEEGTWTPTVTAYTGSLSAYTSNGSYRKVGGMVTISFIFTVTTVGTAGGVAKISNLPFGLSGANVSSGIARENAVSGFSGGAVAASSTEIYVAKYDGSTPFVVNNAWVCQVTYPV